MLLLDHLGLQQQGSDRACRADMADALGLAQQPGLIGIAHVRQQAAAQVDALADVQRQVALCAMEDIHTRCRRHVCDGFPQVAGVFVNPDLIEVGPSTAVQLHGQWRMLSCETGSMPQ